MIFRSQARSSVSVVPQGSSNSSSGVHNTSACRQQPLAHAMTKAE